MIDVEALKALAEQARLGLRDADFIAAANPAVVLELIERLEQAEARIAEALAVHRRVPSIGGFGHYCDKCRDVVLVDEQPWGTWPCKTVRILTTEKEGTE